MKELTGTSAFVTGAVSGIGLGIATALVLAGRKVMLSKSVEATLADPVAGLKQAGADVDGSTRDSTGSGVTPRDGERRRVA